MVNENNIKTLLSKMTNNVKSNIKEIKKVFGSLNYTDDENQSILHILVDNKYDENKCFLAIQSLLQNGMNPNLQSYFNYNFIQVALYTGYSENFILCIINESLKCGLNVNHVDSDNDTIMHTAIYSDDYLGNLEKIYDLLCENGFDSTLVDGESRNLVEAMIYQKQYSKTQIESFRKKYIERTNNDLNDKTSNNMPANEKLNKEKTCSEVIPKLSREDIVNLEKYGTVLNYKKYVTEPTIGREKELKNLMISLAQNKKSSLIVGESGVGKTALVEELVYRIITNQVPTFLQNKVILEINPSEIVSGCKYVGTFEEKIKDLLNLCKELDIIIFIDEIHTMYGTGSYENNDNDMASMLKYQLDRSDLKFIGTTTKQEYEKYFNGDALKRRFDKITMKEPDKNVLYQIIYKVIDDYNITTGISFENGNLKNQLVEIIATMTEKSHRVYDDMVNNPDLAISIIDKAYAIARFYDSKFITVNHFIEAIEYCDRVYELTKNQAITKLNDLCNCSSKSSSKILRLDFKNLKK